ncbi:hypothetical protein [Aeromicrobium sp.]|uniref:hypothetical protein n=1 Tax=Aeromicrobium sp. TaxID=1871063 RepID=UPI0019BEAC3A|nr:hypothetical protein [Aeromicrobium sp.]MBC7632977.1 hypothetical protein [Aeromicrobium sp.]
MSGAAVVAPCHLYHLYDVAGRLLYVGMTGDVDARMEQHEKAQAWWPLVDRRWVVTYPSRGACAAAEALTIHLLRPPHNVAVPDATRCAALTERSGTEIPAAVDVVVEVDEQRRRADRAEARVAQLERALERAVRRIADCVISWVRYGVPTLTSTESSTNWWLPPSDGPDSSGARSYTTSYERHGHGAGTSCTGITFPLPQTWWHSWPSS